MRQQSCHGDPGDGKSRSVPLPSLDGQQSRHSSLTLKEFTITPQSSQLKVLHCIASLNARDGGPARSVPALANAVANAGVEVRVWSRRPATTDLTNFQSAKFLSGPLSAAITSDWVPDIIHDHGLWLSSNHNAAQVGRHNGIPRMVSPRGMLEPWCLKHRQFRKKIAWKLYQYRDLRTAACLHATSDSEADQFRRLGLDQPIVLLPNGVSLPTAESLTRKTINADSNPEREVLFLSRIHPVKGLPHLIEAWGNARRPNWRLKIVGSDEDGHKQEIQKQIVQHELQDSITICDAVHSEEKWALLKNADLVVLPSFSENFGIVIAEALAAGTPVITSTGTPWKGIVSERCGWYVAPSVEGFTTALSDAMNQEGATLREMGNRGQKWVLQAFAWADIGKNMIGAYEWLLGQSDADASEYIHKSPQRQAS